jgi:hypothetical protein
MGAMIARLALCVLGALAMFGGCHLFSGMQAVDAKPMHATFGIEDARIVGSGDPERSILFYRLSRRGPAQMPPLGSVVVDESTVDLVRRWIESLPAPPP